MDKLEKERNTEEKPYISEDGLSADMQASREEEPVSGSKDPSSAAEDPDISEEFTEEMPESAEEDYAEEWPESAEEDAAEEWPESAEEDGAEEMPESAEEDSAGEPGAEVPEGPVPEKSGVRSETEKPEDEGPESAQEEDKKPGAAKEKRRRAKTGKEKRGAAEEIPRQQRRRRRSANAEIPERRRESLAQSLQEYKEKLMNYRTRKWLRYGAIALAVLAAVLIAGAVVKNWKYSSCSVILFDTEEDVISSDYCSIGGNILKYSPSGAVLADKSNRTIWSVSYSMQTPTVKDCGDTVAIYDRNGTTVCICDGSGQIGAVSTDAPIIKADVAAQGVVAAILEDNENTWIQYYDQNGESISMIRTTIDSPGYPMDLGLSDDGTLLAVSYLCFENGQPKTRLYFYNFGSVGQNVMDNRVSSFEFGDILVPQIEYLSGNTCVAFREDGFTLYGGALIPEERAAVQVTGEILSTFYDSGHVGLVLSESDSGTGVQIVVYDTEGREVFRQESDFSYRSIELKDGQIVMSNQSEMCVYSLEGVEKFRGSLGQAAREVFSVGQNRYVMITEDGLNVMKLQ
jgi:hypothetical protein